MKQWGNRLLALAVLVLLGLGGHSIFHAAINDQLNTEARAGNVPRMQSLLRRGADVGGRSIQSKSPLMSAAEGGSGNAVLFLLAQGADVNAHNGSGSVLMWAAASGNVGVVRVLLFHGADAKWRSDSGGTALQMAREYKQPVIAEMLQAAGAKN